MTDTTPTHDVVVACTPDAIPREKHERWIEVGKQFYGSVMEVRELPDGYACRIPSDVDMLLLTAEYISFDRLCCAFLSWKLVIEPNSGPVWLHITGNQDAKTLTRIGFETTNMLNIEVARAAGFDVSSRTDVYAPGNVYEAAAVVNEATARASNRS
jgi:hypothetical protein